MVVQRLSDLIERSGVKFGTSGARGLLAPVVGEPLRLPPKTKPGRFTSG